MSWSCTDGKGCKFVDSKRCLKCGVSAEALKADHQRELEALRAAAPAVPDLQMKPTKWNGMAAAHDFELEPSDDSIAALQHQVAVSRERGELESVARQRGELLTTQARKQVLSALANSRPTATEWLLAAARAMEAYELEKEREG